MDKKLNIIFMGTPKFAVPALRAVHSKYGVKAVVTATDKPKGRGHLLLPSDVKAVAIELDIPVLQPEKFKDENFLNQLKSLEPDIIIVVAFRILPPEVYTMPKIGCFNIHGSLLPKYRGAAPINWSIVGGEKLTGLTSFLLQEKVDTGDILLQRVIPVPDGTTAGDLHDLLMPVSADLATDTVELLLKGNYKLLTQNDGEATPAPKIFTETVKIDWSANAETVRNRIQGFSPVPGAWTMWNGKKFKILRADYTLCNCQASDIFSGKDFGEFLITKESFLVRCGIGHIRITELQLEGKKVMKTADFLRGYKGESSGKFDI